MPSKGFKREAVGGSSKELSEKIFTPEAIPTSAEKPQKNRGGRPRGSTKKIRLAKEVRDKILQRFRIDEFLDLVDTDPRVKRYFYLELIPKMLPRMSEKEVEEKFGVSFYFGDDTKHQQKSTSVSKKKQQEAPVELPMSLVLTDAPLPEGLK